MVGKQVLAARARTPGPAIEKVVGSTVEGVESRGKHLVMRFSNGLALHSHMRMHGAWHRYAPGERWRIPPSRARVVMDLPGSVLVCFDAPVVELLRDEAINLHPAIDSLGPDLLAEQFDVDEAFRRLRAPERAEVAIADALLDQRVLAGVGNVFKSEVLFVERVNPWTLVSDLDDAALRRILATSERLLRANADPRHIGRVTTVGTKVAEVAQLFVYGRSGRPCFRCRTLIRSRKQGPHARVTYWCPKCQA